jgi:hypothetical protein
VERDTESLKIAKMKEERTGTFDKSMEISGQSLEMTRMRRYPALDG